VTAHALVDEDACATLQAGLVTHINMHPIQHQLGATGGDGTRKRKQGQTDRRRQRE
jgi:hypothetical protein